jgi:hypothetical protein
VNAQKQISGLLYDSEGNKIEGVLITSINSAKTGNPLSDGTFIFDTSKFKPYDDIELIIRKKGWHLIPSEDSDVLKIDPKSNRVIVTVQARIRNMNQSLVFRMIKDEEKAKDILFYRIQVRATKQSISKETLAYLQKKVDDLNTKIVEEKSKTGIFPYKYVLENNFNSRSQAEEFGKTRLKDRFSKTLIMPYYN